MRISVRTWENDGQAKSKSTATFVTADFCVGIVLSSRSRVGISFIPSVSAGSLMAAVENCGSFRCSSFPK